MRPRLCWALLAAVVVALSGCGASDGSVGVGEGQQPDPVAPDFPIAYTKGPLFDEDMELLANTDVRDVLRFNVGTDLYVRDRASPTAPERNVTFRETQGQGDVMGAEISTDGAKVLFAMRGPVDPNLGLDDEDQPTWNIWEYTISTDTLRRIIASDITAEAGQDISPHYLPDGRIIFVSTRQRQAKAVLLDEGKPQFDARDEDRQQPAFVLHVMRDDGSDLRQVSFNQSSDYDPTVLDNGKVLFSRWDHAGGVYGIHLYEMNPVGTERELVYGAESHLTGRQHRGSLPRSARDVGWPHHGHRSPIRSPRAWRSDYDHRYADLRREQAARSQLGGYGRSCADAGHAESSADGPVTVARRPIQLGVPVVGRHGTRAR
jgi:hypothetical protein